MKARVIAYYLPQFHPIPQNDKFWGKGFTEWTNVAKAKPLFRGHVQPKIPADLGFYDLRLDEVRKEQAELAKEAGVEGFCYWHYWFGNGEQVLEMPFKKVVESGEPDFPFCLGWANHDWTTKTWDKGKALAKSTMIFEQKYLGDEDHIKHFYELLPAFKDPRYITVDGKLLFAIFAARRFENVKGFIELWNNLAKENGLNGFHFVALTPSLLELNKETLKNLENTIRKNFEWYYENGFDAVNSINMKYAELKAGGLLHKAFYGFIRKTKLFSAVEKYDYEKIMANYFTPVDRDERVYPQLLAGWDRSPRAGKKAIVYYNNNPKTFGNAAKNAVDVVKDKQPEHRLIFVNSWNEWGEGAYLEPDQEFGKGKIKALREALD